MSQHHLLCPFIKGVTMLMETKEDDTNCNWEKTHEHFPSVTSRTWWTFVISIFFKLPRTPKDSDYLRWKEESRGAGSTVGLRSVLSHL